MDVTVFAADAHIYEPFECIGQIFTTMLVASRRWVSKVP
jgi:hypothetical protein